MPEGSPLAVTVAPSIAVNAMRSPYSNPTVQFSITPPPWSLNQSSSSASFSTTVHSICAVFATVFFPLVTFFVKVTK